MNTQQLETFVQVAENLNFARASEILNITQSAVSRQIQALEEELDTKLFYRTTRTVSLTLEGMIFLDHAKQILGQLKIVTAKLQHHTNATMQTLTIGCESELDLDFLCEILNQARQQTPAFHPIVKLVPHRPLMNLFYQQEIEILFGLQESLPIHPDMVFMELKKTPLCCVLPRTHPYAQKQRIAEQELFSQRLIICTSYTASARAMELQNRIAQHISPEKIYVSENPQVVLSLIRAGYGCSILPQAIYRDADTVYVPLENAPMLTYGVIYNRTSSHPVLKNFVAMLEKSSSGAPL